LGMCVRAGCGMYRCKQCATPLLHQVDIKAQSDVVNVGAVCQGCPSAFCKSCFFGGKVNRAGTSAPRCVVSNLLFPLWACV
jgi:hypothetical protein